MERKGQIFSGDKMCWKQTVRFNLASQWRRTEMHYPIAIIQEPDQQFRVIIPDVTSIEAKAASIERAMTMAKENLELHLDQLSQQDKPIPRPHRLEDHKENPDYATAVWALIPIDISKHLGKCKRINITMPERLLIQIDKHLALNGSNRSAFLAECAMNALSRRHYPRRRKKNQNNDNPYFWALACLSNFIGDKPSSAENK